MEKRCNGCMKIKSNSPICEHCGFDERNQNQPHQLPQGTILQGQYLVGRVLGQGGFGITYLGWDLNLDIPIAIKEYYPVSCVSRDCTLTHSVVTGGPKLAEQFHKNRTRFLQEARVLAKLRNIPGIVQVHNFFEINNTAYIIMEYLDGIDLKEYLQQRGSNFDIHELLNLLRPVMYALKCIHDVGIIHRDVTPDNIMLLSNGSVKLLDFGAVREVETGITGQGLPQSTTAILKHGFAPMEQYHTRGNLGPWTDIYAICATIYYCTTGQNPPDAPERMMEGACFQWNQIPNLTQYQIQALENGTALRLDERTHSIQELCVGLYGEYETSILLGEAVTTQPKIGNIVMVTATGSQNQGSQFAPVTSQIIQKSPQENDHRSDESSKQNKKGLIIGIAAVFVAIIGASVFFGLGLGKSNHNKQPAAPTLEVEPGYITVATDVPPVSIEIETTAAPLITASDYGACGATTTWTLFSNGELRISGEGSMTNFQTEMETPWYQYADQITSVVIERTVSSIGGHSFYNCNNLMKVVIMDGVSDIRGFAFAECDKLKEIVIPDSVENMGGYVLQGCTDLETAVISQNLTFIPAFTFDGCTALTAVTLSSELQRIDRYSFNNCEKLQTINFDGTEGAWRRIVVEDHNDGIKNATITFYTKYLESSNPN